MSDDAQKLNDKMSAKMSDDELDNVAGGSFAQNQDILVAMGNIDPEGVKNLLKDWGQGTKGEFKDKLTILINKNLKNFGVTAALSSDKVDNFYIVGGKKMGHAQFMEFLNGIGKKDDDF